MKSHIWSFICVYCNKQEIYLFHNLDLIWYYYKHPQRAEEKLLSQPCGSEEKEIGGKGGLSRGIVVGESVKKGVR